MTNVAATVSSVRNMLPRIKPYSGIRQRIVERENAGEGTVTFALALEQTGAMLIVR